VAAVAGTAQAAGTINLNSLTSFTRTVALLPSAGTIVVITTSGFTVLAANYDAAVASPFVQSVINAADGTQPMAPGWLTSVFGPQMSPVNIATSQIPLPTALGQSCPSVNGAPVPLLFVSPADQCATAFQRRRQRHRHGHPPGGISNNYNFTVQSAAPSVLMSGTAGSQTGLLVRADNNQLVTPMVTPTNPLPANDTVVIYLTGLRATTPPVDAGVAAPSNPLAAAAIPPALTLRGMALNLLLRRAGARRGRGVPNQRNRAVRHTSRTFGAAGNQPGHRRSHLVQCAGGEVSTGGANASAWTIDSAHDRRHCGIRAAVGGRRAAF